jgi:hypothetical protein
MVRRVVAVIVGYLVMAVLIGITTLIHFKSLGIGVAELQKPHPDVPTSFAIINLIYSSLYAAFGGWVCAAIEKQNRLKAGMALAVLLFVLSLISAYMDRGKQPMWYQACLVVFGPLATYLGASIRAKKA